jgi:spermidine/putrescine transport system ATP-binding protein
LDEVSLRIRRGEFFCLLGPSGCGKTTLLRIIAGLDTPDGGQLRINGLSMQNVPAHRRPVNTVFQSYALFPHMNVRDNVAFGLRMNRTPERELVARVGKIMDLVRITDLASRMPGELSGGQKQRVALARAIVNEPDVLLLDEPLGALDLKLRKELQTELHRLQRRLKITFVHVTHDQDEALAMSDRIAVMNSGRIEQMGSSADLYERPRTRFVARFLGSCNLLRGEWDGHRLRTPIGSLEMSLPTQPAGSGVTVAIRPEKIALCSEPESGVANAFPAVIRDMVYRGAETQFELLCGEHPLTAVQLNTAPSPQLRVGGQAWCVLPSPALVPLED